MRRKERSRRTKYALCPEAEPSILYAQSTYLWHFYAVQPPSWECSWQNRPSPQAHLPFPWQQPPWTASQGGRIIKITTSPIRRKAAPSCWLPLPEKLLGHTMASLGFWGSLWGCLSLSTPYTHLSSSRGHHKLRSLRFCFSLYQNFIECPSCARLCSKAKSDLACPLGTHRQQSPWSM